jgi:tetratricopeptide (TPR) repeat protein
MKKNLIVLLTFTFVLVFGLSSEEIDNFFDKWDDAEGLKSIITYVLSIDERSETDCLYIEKAYFYTGRNFEDKKDRVKNFKKAVEWADEGLKINPDNVDILYYKAAAFGKIGIAKGVLKSLFLVKPIKKLCNRILELDKNYPGAYHILGVMYRKLPGWKGGDKKKSEEYLKKAIELEPNFSLHFYELAETELKLKKKKEAKEILNKIIKEDFDKDLVQQGIDKKAAKEMITKLK